MSTRDTSNVLPGIKGIPWVKLYVHTKPRAGSPGEFVADIEYDVDMDEGRLEFVVPDVGPGTYFFLGECNLVPEERLNLLTRAGSWRLHLPHPGL